MMRARWWAAAASAGLAVVIAVTCGLLLTRHAAPAALRAAAARESAPAAAPSPTGSLADAFPVPTAPIVAKPQPAQAAPVARPAALTIPEIGVSTDLITLGLTAQGTVQVPPTTAVAGWYTGSPRPGAVGSSVILGHINSYKGPGVFVRLDELRPGDPVYVRRADGSTVEFRVTSVQSYLKALFPSQKIYGATPDAELRLVTCGGAFDAATGHYLSNVVVFATATS